MKRIVLLLLAVCMVTMNVPVHAADMTKEEKDQCLLASRNCADEVDSIQKKIMKLQAEIKKGEKVYSTEEINKLNAKLKEAEQMLDDMMKGGN